MWTWWVLVSLPFLGNPPHRVVILGIYVIKPWFRNSEDMFHYHGLPREAKKPCMKPAGDDRFLYRFEQGLREPVKKKGGKKK